MKEDFIEQLKNHARDVRPSAEWFSVTKQHLASYMRLHPQSTKPAYQATGISWQYIIAPLRSMTRLTPAFIALGAIVIFGTISATAYSSLPGDALYSWKIGINEPVESLFAIGSAQRAQFQVTLVDRRLTEVSEVLAHGGNTGKNSATARVQLEVQTLKARTQIARVASQNNEAALDVAINLDAKLKAHRELIHLLETKTVDDTQTEVRDTISSIEKTSTAIATSIAELEKKNQDSAENSISETDHASLIQDKIKDLDGHIAAIIDSIKAIPDDSPLKMRAEEQFSSVQKLRTHIDALEAAKKYSDALKEIHTLTAYVADVEALLTITAKASNDVKRVITGNTQIPPDIAAPDAPASSSARFNPTVSIATDKTQYAPGETMIVQVEASNASSLRFAMSWRTGRPSNYRFDAPVNITEQNCIQVMTQVSVAPKSSHAWIFKATAPRAVGSHTVFGEIFTYGKARGVFTVADGIASSSLQTHPQL